MILMIYLDYSATTPVRKEVLDTFNKVSLDFVGNANSIHKLGVKAHNLIEEATEQIKKILKIEDKEIIYTSSSSEANNLALKGLCFKYGKDNKRIITSPYEHSSIKETLNYLETLGFKIEVLKCDENGWIDLEHLKELLKEKTLLVTINHVSSELGLIEPINEIGKIIKENSNAFFHVDLTQSIGKIDVDLSNIDLGSFSAHKIFGIKGIACLFKNPKISLIPLIHGGKSTTIYRSGTPAHPLIASFSKALRLANEDMLNNYQKVKDLNNYLQENLSKFSHVYINSNKYCLPHILNISIIGIKPETMVHALEKENVFVSTKSACSDDNSFSESVLTFTNDMNRAKSSIRISLSYLTTKEELEQFLNIFNKVYNDLNLK